MNVERANPIARLQKSRGIKGSPGAKSAPDQISRSRVDSVTPHVTVAYFHWISKHKNND